jgi:hypothetical protein
VPKKDNTGFLLSSQNHDKSRIPVKTASEKSLFHTTTRKVVVLVMMGWQDSNTTRNASVAWRVLCSVDDELVMFMNVLTFLLLKNQE